MTVYCARIRFITSGAEETVTFRSMTGRELYLLTVAPYARELSRWIALEPDAVAEADIHAGEV